MRFRAGANKTRSGFSGWRWRKQTKHNTAKANNLFHSIHECLKRNQTSSVDSFLFGSDPDHTALVRNATFR
jgi:hypothetical protein